MRRILILFQESIFVRNSLVLFAGTMAANVLNYAFHFSLGRMVDAETYGALQSLIALLAIVSVPAAALTMIATKYGAAAKAREDYSFGHHLFLYLNKKIIKYGWPLIIIGIILIPLTKSFLKIDDTFAIAFLWALAALAFFSSVSIGILSGWQKFGAVNTAGIIGTGIKLLLGVFLAYLGFGLDGILFGFVLAGTVGYFISVNGLKFLARGHKDSQAENSEEVEKEMDFSSVRGYVSAALTGTLGLVALGNTDIILAKHILDPELAGVYGALSIVAKVIFFATGVIATVLFSMSSESVEKNNNENNGKPQNFLVFWSAFALTIFISAMAITFYFLAPEFVMKIFFGSKYLAAAPYLGWFGLAAGLYAVVNLILQQLLSMHITRAAWSILTIAILESLTLFFLGSDIISIIKIVIGAQILALIFGLAFVLKECKIQVNIKI
jgi:O-antigen/teichoic acid export membrane protein